MALIEYIKLAAVVAAVSAFIFFVVFVGGDLH